MKAIDNKELEIALEALEKERGIKKEYLMEQQQNKLFPILAKFILLSIIMLITLF